MHPSMFNVRVPLDQAASGGDVFLMNTFTDAQLVVSRDVAGLLDRIEAGNVADAFTADEREAVSTLAEHGFLVTDRASERRQLHDFFHQVREGQDAMRVTVLTTLQCNFACDYCFQGDHGDYNTTATKMTLETSARVSMWIETRLDALRPKTFTLTFFGGEPLLNLPAMYDLAARVRHACDARGVTMAITVITNGLLLTPEVVDRLKPFGLTGVKITLDGDRETHNRMRPLRGGQGTFDKIISNIRRIAGKCRINIGGNFDMSSADSYPALLDFLRAQDFADSLTRVSFKPVIREPKAMPAPSVGGTRFIPLAVVSDTSRPLNGTCMTSAGAGTGACDSCGQLDEKMTFLREETKKRGFKTVDGVHMGPCEIHQRHAYTIGPGGDLYACPGFTGDASQSTGHIDGRVEAIRNRTAERFDAIAAWKQCDGCAFIPVCAGGCSVAAHTELGDMNRPNCHKSSFEAGVVSLARDAAASSALVH